MERDLGYMESLFCGKVERHVCGEVARNVCGEVESPSLGLDNWWNLGLTFDLSVWIRQGGPIQVVEQEEVPRVEDGHEMMVIKLNLEKKKEKNKTKEIKAKV